MMSYHKLNNKKGSSIIQVLIGFAIAIFFISLSSKIYLDSLKNSYNSEVRANLTVIRNNYLRILQDNRSWYNTLYEYKFNSMLGKMEYQIRGINSKTFNCLFNPKQACMGLNYTTGKSDEYIFQLYDSTNQSKANGSIATPTSLPVEILVDPNVTNGTYKQNNWGYDYKGNVCFSFSPSGNDNCPFQLQFTWKPICENGPCQFSNNLINPLLDFIKVCFKFKT